MKTLIYSTAVAVVASLSANSAALAGDGPHHTASTELRWMETPIGASASPISGDMNTGAHITYMRFPAGMKTPLHSHTHSYVGMVISGTSRHWVPGQPGTQKDLGAGAHWSMPAGQEHVSECLPGLDCVMAVMQEGAFDFLTEAQPGAEKR